MSSLENRIATWLYSYLIVLPFTWAKERGFLLNLV
jgi:hypothetical protein